jgi:hypothetical protein
MKDHSLLTGDRSVQQRFFANGIITTVNFGDVPYYLADGTKVPSMGFVETRLT